MSAETLLFASGLVAFLITIYWVRRREMKEKYATFWLFFGAGIFVLGICPQIVYHFAVMFHLTNAAAVLFITLIILFFWAFSVSISLSRLHRRSIRLTQEIGLLEKQTRDLERRLDEKSASEK